MHVNWPCICIQHHSVVKSLVKFVLFRNETEWFCAHILQISDNLEFTSSILMFFQWEDKDGKLSGMIIYLKLTCVRQNKSKEKCYLLKALGNVTCKSNLTFF